VILGIVRDYLRGEAADHGVVFDGFPRTIPQARGLDALLAELNRPLRAVLVLEVDDDALVKRLSGRRTCPQCGAVYNVYFEPPRIEGRCDRCGAELSQRPDDGTEPVKRRLEVYHEQTAPLLDYYDASPVTVHRLNGDRPVDVVQEDLVRTLKS
jgi:adenylate kinase